MQPNEQDSSKARREFLKTTAIGVTAAACASALSSCGVDDVDCDKVKLLTQDGQFVELDSSQVKYPQRNVIVSSEEARKGIPGRKFVMVIDLSKCNNARKCVTACQKMHYLPEETEWLAVRLMKDAPETSPYWFPKTCFQCDNPPCVKVCPVDATFKRQDGIVLIDNERCIGCKFCMAACPYSTRVFNWSEPEQPDDVRCAQYSPETSVPARIGTVEKCDFCPDMMRAGKLPDCVIACPNGVFYFGDENDDAVSNGTEIVRFSKLIKERAGYRYMEELGTKPRVWYLPPTDRIFPVERGLDALPEDIKERFKDVPFGQEAG